MKYYFVSYAFVHNSGTGTGFGCTVLEVEGNYFNFSETCRYLDSINSGKQCIVMYYKEMTKREYEANLPK